MKITGSAWLVLATLSVASADPVITTSVTCHAFGYQAVTSAASCSLGTPPTQQPYPPYAAATSSASVGLQQAASDWLTISMRVDVSAIDGARYVGVPDAASAANGQNTIHIDFITPGPERAGILEEQWQPVWSGNPGDFEGAATYTIRNYSAGCGGGGNPNCTGPTPRCDGPGDL